MTKRKLRRSTRQCTQQTMDEIDEEPSSPPPPESSTPQVELVAVEEDLTGKTKEKFNLEVEESQQSEKQEVDEVESIFVSPSPSHQCIEMSDDQDSSYVPPTPASATTTTVSLDLESHSPVSYKRGPQQGKKALNRKQQAILNKKQEILMKKLEEIKMNLRIIPFVPAKKLDFGKHEELFRKLQLWDFVHVQFDREVDLDLLGELIATYDRNVRSSNVRSYRIMVNRADLARAVKLPVKKVSQSEEIDAGVLSAESISFLGEFVSNWILLHEDTWILPDEVLTWTKLIKEGKPQKVDWAEMIWYMVKKELAKGAKLQTCYYASHLQCLMKSQRGDLFKEENRVETKLESEVSVDIKMKSVEEFQVNNLENEEDTELTLGQERNESRQQQVRGEEDVMDFEEEGKAPAHPSEWLLDGKKKMNDISLRPCSSNKPESLEDHFEVNNLDDDEVDVEDEEEEDEEDPPSKILRLSRMPSDLFQPMEVSLKKVHLLEARLIKFSEDVKRFKELAVQPKVSKSGSEAVISKEEEDENLSVTTMKLDVCVRAAAGASDFLGDCLFSQRVLLTLEEKKIPYQMHLIDSANKPRWFLEANPEGTLPVVYFDGKWVPGLEVITQALDEKYPDSSLVTPSEFSSVGSRIYGYFDTFLKSTNASDGSEQALISELSTLDEHLKAHGPYVNGEKICAVDLGLAPTLYHLEIALGHFKSWSVPDTLTRIINYMKLLFSRESFIKTKPTDKYIIAGFGPMEPAGPGEATPME